MPWIDAARFLTERSPSGANTKHHDTFNVERYVVDMCGQGMMGTMYSETLQKNYKVSYDEMVEDTGNRLLVFFTQLVESAVDNLAPLGLRSVRKRRAEVTRGPATSR